MCYNNTADNNSDFTMTKGFGEKKIVKKKNLTLKQELNKHTKNLKKTLKNPLVVASLLIDRSMSNGVE
jgi:hypothetical protein